MAKQVIWSLVAKKQLKEAFQILKLKNGNNEVGEVLYVQLQNILHRISMNPFIGQTTEIENIRYIIPQDRKSTRLNSSHNRESRMPSSA